MSDNQPILDININAVVDPDVNVQPVNESGIDWSKDKRFTDWSIDLVKRMEKRLEELTSDKYRKSELKRYSQITPEDAREEFDLRDKEQSKKDEESAKELEAKKKTYERMGLVYPGQNVQEPNLKEIFAPKKQDIDPNEARKKQYEKMGLVYQPPETRKTEEEIWSILKGRDPIPYVEPPEPDKIGEAVDIVNPPKEEPAVPIGERPDWYKGPKKPRENPFAQPVEAVDEEPPEPEKKQPSKPAQKQNQTDQDTEREEQLYRYRKGEYLSKKLFQSRMTGKDMDWKEHARYFDDVNQQKLDKFDPFAKVVKDIDPGMYVDEAIVARCEQWSELFKKKNSEHFDKRKVEDLLDVVSKITHFALGPKARNIFELGRKIWDNVYVPTGINGRKIENFDDKVSVLKGLFHAAAKKIGWGSSSTAKGSTPEGPIPPPPKWFRGKSISGDGSDIVANHFGIDPKAIASAIMSFIPKVNPATALKVGAVGFGIASVGMMGARYALAQNQNALHNFQTTYAGLGQAYEATRFTTDAMMTTARFWRTKERSTPFQKNLDELASDQYKINAAYENARERNQASWDRLWGNGAQPLSHELGKTMSAWENLKASTWRGPLLLSTLTKVVGEEIARPFRTLNYLLGFKDDGEVTTAGKLYEQSLVGLGLRSQKQQEAIDQERAERREAAFRERMQAAIMDHVGSLEAVMYDELNALDRAGRDTSLKNTGRPMKAVPKKQGKK